MDDRKLPPWRRRPTPENNLQALFVNMLRISRGAGAPYLIDLQISRIMDAWTAADRDCTYFIELIRRDAIYLGGPDRGADWLDRVYNQIVRAALKVAAEELSGDKTQLRHGRNALTQALHLWRDEFERHAPGRRGAG